MKLKLSLKLFLAIMFTTVMTGYYSAQPETDIWFWAWRSYDLDVEHAEDQRGDLLSYTPNGTINVLLEDVYSVVLQRIDDTQAFVSNKTNDTYSLYYLTPTQAVHVTELFNQDYVDEYRSHVTYIGYDYLTPEIIPAGEKRYLIADIKQGIYLIFDANQKISESLELQAWCREDCVRVSADGRYIRYRVTQSDPFLSSQLPDPHINALPYQIYEYDISRDTERLIYEREAVKEAVEVDEGLRPPKANCTPDQFGDRWYCELYLDDDINWVGTADEKIIVHTDSSIEKVNPDWRLRVFDQQWYFLDLDMIRDNCDPCFISVFPDGNEAEVFQFKVPPKDEFAFWFDEIVMLNEHFLIPNPTGQPMFALSRSGELTELGARPCCADPTSLDFYDEASGWMIAINIEDPKAAYTQIWNTHTLEQLASFSIEIQPGVQSTFRDYSFVLFDRILPTIAFSYIDEVLYTFDFMEYREFIDAFDGGVLVAGYGKHQNRYIAMNDAYQLDNDAIYRWKPIEGEILIVDGAIPIPSK